MVKNLPAIQETWVQFLGQEDPLVKEMAPTPVFLPEKCRGQRGLVAYSPQGCKELHETEQLTFSDFNKYQVLCKVLSVYLLTELSSQLPYEVSRKKSLLCL